MKSKLVVLMILMFAVSSVFAANGFTRTGEIPIPEADLNNGGIGAMISGVDIDGDGNKEIYLVNNNWNDEASELIPRIYKMEWDGSAWATVWSAIAPVTAQNTWPQLKIADLDNDGKEELVWAVINNSTGNPNRIVVYEHLSGDNFGVDTTGGYKPNSVWTVGDADGLNIRPMDMEIYDIDNDGTNEVIFADRKGSSGSGYYFVIGSVDDIPDAGDASETWTLEASGLDYTVAGNIQNKWDMARIDSNLYFFDEEIISKVSWDGSAYQYSEFKAIPAGSPNQSAVGLDLDDDGTKEIVTAIYDWGDDTQKGVYVLQEDGDTLTHTMVADMAVYWDGVSRGAWGSAHGDIDGNGNMDFVFGSRGGVTNACIFRCEYKGGDITLASNYDVTIIDSAYTDDGIWSNINIADMDSDPGLEVLYSSSVSYGSGVVSVSSPIIILEADTSGTSVEFDNLPETFTLFGNYPNPFNPSTTIKYELSAPSQVTIQIFDISGKRVAMLVNTSQKANVYEVQWNPTNISSGVYFGRVSVRNSNGYKTEVIKMTYMK